MPIDLPRRELATSQQLDIIMTALTSPRRAWVERMYGSRAYRVFIVGDRLRPVAFGAYGAAELAEAFAWLGPSQDQFFLYSAIQDARSWQPRPKEPTQ